MNKKIYLAVLAIVTTLCILAGTAYHFLHWGMDTIGGWNFSWRNDSNNPKTVLEPTELAEFSQISVDAEVMSLTVEVGNTYQIAYKCNKKTIPTYQVENGVLTIRQELSGSASLNNPKNWGGNNMECTVHVTVPSRAALEMITVQIDMGDLDVIGVSSAAANLTASMGDMDVERCDLGDTVITANMGDVDMERCKFTNLTVNMDMGNVDIESSSDLSAHTISASVDLGELEVNDRSYRNNFSQTGTGDYTVTIVNHMGDVDLTY